MEDAAKIAARLTRLEQSALTPFTVFSKSVGRSLEARGLLQCHDGVWNHTEAGMQVFRALAKADKP